MDKLRQAAQQALEALEIYFDAYPHMQKGYVMDAIVDLRAAIEQALTPGEAVAEIVCEDVGRPFNAMRITTHFYKEVPPVGTKLYTAPQPQREWVGLTDEEWQDLSDKYGLIIFGRFKIEIEAMLREKNHGLR